MAQVQSLVFAWLREEDWSEWRSIDSNLHPQHGAWLAQSEARLKQFEALGHRINKVTILPAEFLAWSRASGAGVDSNARAKFVAVKAARKHTNH